MSIKNTNTDCVFSIIIPTELRNAISTLWQHIYKDNNLNMLPDELAMMYREVFCIVMSNMVRKRCFDTNSNDIVVYEEDRNESLELYHRVLREVSNFSYRDLCLFNALSQHTVPTDSNEHAIVGLIELMDYLIPNSKVLKELNTDSIEEKINTVRSRLIDHDTYYETAKAYLSLSFTFNRMYLSFDIDLNMANMY